MYLAVSRILEINRDGHRRAKSKSSQILNLYIHTNICMCAKRTDQFCRLPLLFNRGQSNREENEKIITNKSLSLITPVNKKN